MNTRPPQPRSRFRRAGERLAGRGRRTWVADAARRSDEIGLATHTLALAAQQVMCTVPLLLAVSALLRRFHAGGVVGLVSDLLQLDEPSRQALMSLFLTREHTSVGALLLELAWGTIFLMGLAATTQDMLEAVWGVQQDRRGRWVRQGIWVLAAVPCLAVAMVTGRYMHRWLGGPPTSWFFAALVEGLAALVFYWWTQHLLLGGAISWRRLAPGSVMSGLGMAGATLASAWLVPGQIVEQVGYYGPIGAAVVLSLWLMGVTTVVVLAVLAGAVLDERRRAREGVVADV
ncbi:MULTISPECIES: hypothetical protein [unclassified Luteococcus]|uniref:hypothetical protein n=1 Tax=unclassified Luteococcus TaxID=2639923 RepID=UPI00313CE9B5